LEFGYNSTTIILQDNETENLGDSYIDKFNPTSNFGTSETIQLYQEGGGSTKEMVYLNLILLQYLPM